MNHPRSALLWALLASTFVAACSVVPYRTARNLPLCPQLEVGQHPAINNSCLTQASARAASSAEVPRSAREPLPAASRPYAVPRARKDFVSTDKDMPKAFIGLALSGGGSRAANYSLAVMEQLEVLGLMRHVTAISSTSGGGLPAAYYAINGPEINWDEARGRMGTNFLGQWLFKSLRPDNLVVTGFTHEDRSDLMADIFDDVLFGRATYGDLKELGPGHPIFLANATHAQRGSRFTFTHDDFRDNLRSRLDQFPISQAVMASAAFPGAFNSVTLKRYPGIAHPQTTRGQVPIGYDHLLDGGPSDNLGVEALIELASTHQYALAEREQRQEQEPATQAPCFFFVVDAYPPGVPGRKAWTPDPRGILDHIVDLNFIEAFDAVLIRRRADLLGYAGLGHRRGTGGSYIGDFVQPLFLKDLGSELISPATQLVEVDIPRDFLQAGHGWSRIRPVILSTPKFDRKTMRAIPPAAPPVDKAYFRCTVWHLNLSGMLDIKPYVAGPTPTEARRLQNDNAGREHPLLARRAKLQRLVSQIDTNFKLAGPPSCSSMLLQQAIYTAAFVVTREDHFNRKKVCEWFAGAGMPVSDQCLGFPESKSLALDLDLKAVGPLISERPGDIAVDCVDK